MTEQEILSQLLDIQSDYLPSEPPFWPPAPGWWLVFFLVLLLLFLVFFFIYRSLKQQQAKTRFWREIEAEWQTLQAMPNDEKKFFHYSLFIRKLTKALHGASFARLQGQAWLDFLQHSAGKDFTLPSDFSWEEGLYHPTKLTDQSWFSVMDQWIAMQKRLNKSIVNRKQIKQRQ